MVAVDSTHLYWTEDRTGTAWKAKKDGTDKERIFNANKANGTWGIATAGDTGVWIVSRANAQIVFVPNDGGPTRIAGTEAEPHSIVARFADGVWQPFWTANGSGHVQTLKIPGGVISWTATTTKPTGIAFAPTTGRVYWTTSQNLVWRALADGSGALSISKENNDGSQYITVHGDLVSYTDARANTVWAVRDNDTSSPAPISTDELDPWGIASDSTGVYWVSRKCTEDDARCIRRARLQGNDWKIESIGGYVRDPIGIALDSTHVYVASREDQILYKFSK